MVGAPIGAVDHGIGRALQLVVEATGHQPADDGIVQALAGQHIIGRATLDAPFGQAAMNALDDVAAFAQLAQRRLSVLRHGPLAGTDLAGETERFQLA